MIRKNAIGQDELDTFRKHFQSFQDQYILIGGIATKLLLEEAGFIARATKDLDIVLCVEALTAEFVQQFWNFVIKGEYEVWRKSNGQRCFYRFERPQKDGYPSMLEILSDKSRLFEDSVQVTLPLIVEDELVSLSAILLNREYYHFLLINRKEIDGLIIASEHVIIPLKVCAFLDLSKRKANGELIKGDDIKKHKNDVLRLIPLLKRESLKDVPSIIKKDIQDFIDIIGDESALLEQLNVGVKDMKTLKEVLQIVYCTSS